MKYLKILGLAAVAAAAVMAFVGAATASADVLCTTNTTSACASGWRVTTITASQPAGTTGVLKTTGGTELATCSGAELTLHDEHGGKGVEPKGKVTEISWSGCNTTVDTVATGEAVIETKETAGGVHDNTVTSIGGEVTLRLFGVSCTYGTGTGTSLGDLTTGQDPILHVNAVVAKTAGGGLCPASGRWETTFTVTNHTALWLSEE